MDATNADTRLCMALDARRFAHLARDDHGLARCRSTAGQLPSHISVTRVLAAGAQKRDKGRTRFVARLFTGGGTCGGPIHHWVLLGSEGAHTYTQMQSQQIEILFRIFINNYLYQNILDRFKIKTLII